MTTSKNARKKVGRYLLDLLDEQEWRCALCAQRVVDVGDADVDHIVPVFKGGGSERANLQATHKWCNHARGHNELLTTDDRLGMVFNAKRPA